MTDEVVRLPLNRRRLKAIAAGFGMATGVLVTFIGILPDDRQFDFSAEILLLWALTALLGSICFYVGGIALFTSHGLRIDRHGLSGFYAPVPIKWSDVSDLELVTHTQRSRHDLYTSETHTIILHLKDHDAYWWSMTTAQRLMRFGHRKKGLASIPTAPFKMNEAELLALLQRYWRDNSERAGD